IVGLSQYFVEAGLGGAVIHRQTNDRKELGSANLINISLGLIVSICILLLAKPLALFYNNDELKLPIMVLSIPLFIQGFTIQYTSLLKRDMRFDSNAKIEIVSSISNLICAGIFLLNGSGIYAIIYGSITSMIVKLVLLARLLYPTFGFPLAYDRSSFIFYSRYGAYSIGQSVLNYANREIDVFILGRTISMESLGVYYILK